MTGSGWTYLLFSGALVAVFVGIVVYYYGRRRRERVEAPKYRMLEDDGEPRLPGKGR
jgi:LPXTG-motif cell wall-anchored protein